ncbi:MAG TPA: dipicolinate synthase subunit DpsA [Candidatus Gallacutalibacter stercoravium]|nr:dipicolinate synthase subunit DpsA [Candidatus Gallacutalibacter stercoravium]
MVKIKSFAVIGGDKRQAEMAKSIAADGYTVYAAGLEGLALSPAVQRAQAEKAALQAETVIFPLPASKDGKTVNAPYSAAEIPLSDALAEALRGKMVFCGMKERLRQAGGAWRAMPLHDYFAREEFAVHNAVPTGEGALEIAMREYPGTISGARCLVTGYGRIGKALSAMLGALHANVTVSARKPGDLAWIQAAGFRAVETGSLAQQGETYDIIFNTIPAMIFDAHTLAKTAEGALVIDLASAPGGVDFEAARRLGIPAVQALSLPGKVAPRTAGEIIKNIVYHVTEEGLA